MRVHSADAAAGALPAAAYAEEVRAVHSTAPGFPCGKRPDPRCAHAQTEQQLGKAYALERFRTVPSTAPGCSCGSPPDPPSSRAQTEQQMGKAHALERFREGVRGALRGGGCCASRALFVGACLGARGGADAIPVRWRKRARKHRECFALAERLCALRD